MERLNPKDRNLDLDLSMSQINDEDNGEFN